MVEAAHGVKLHRAPLVGASGGFGRQPQRLEELLQLAWREVAPGAGRDADDLQWPDPEPPQAHHVDADDLHHPSHHMVQPLVQDQLDHNPFVALTQQATLVGHDTPALDIHSVAQP